MHAVLNIDKPKGLTSREAMLRAGRAMGAAKAGHAGTLDPIATGVLLVCLGEATKLSGFLVDLSKEYVTTIKLGERTETFDAEGKVVETAPVPDLTLEDVQEVMERFTGEIEQIPPMYSAVKVAGKPLYKLARKGLEIPRAPRKVRVSELRALRLEPPYLEFRTVCSKGTYVRTLADDIGRALGTFAHIVELRRLRVGPFRADEAALPSELPDKASAIVSPDEALGFFMAEIRTSPRDHGVLRNGGAVSVLPYGKLAPGVPYRLKTAGGKLFAIGSVKDGKVRVKRILHLKS